MPARGWLRRAVGFLNPGMAGLLFILFFIILLAVIGPIALRVGKLLVGPILWLYESNNFSIGLSLVGSIISVIVAIALAGLLRGRRHKAVPAVMANKWFWFFVITYVAFLSVALPVMWPAAAAVLLSLNAPMILAAPLIFITAFGLARDVNEGDYRVAAEAYIALFTSLLLSDLTTAVMADIATEAVHLFTKASLVIGELRSHRRISANTNRGGDSGVDHHGND
jgi:multisubunit Na+/H+ antiporter MnhE subunit